MNLRQTKPILFALSAGILGLCWRVMLYRTGFDDKGILSGSHRLHLGCLILAAIAAVYLALKVRSLPEDTEDCPRLRLGLGLAAGLLLLFHGAALFRPAVDLFCQAADSLLPIRRISGIFRLVSAALPLIRCGLTLAAAGAMAFIVFPGAKESQAAACHGLVCVAFAVDMLSRYRDWSGNPQLPDYVFHVLAGATLCLCAYQTLALHTGLGRPKLRKFWGLLALFLSVLCLSGPDPRAFYLSGGLWGLNCLLTPVTPEPEAEEENDDVSA